MSVRKVNRECLLDLPRGRLGVDDEKVRCAACIHVADAREQHAGDRILVTRQPHKVPRAPAATSQPRA